MITFKFAIQNPWKRENFKHIVSKVFQLTEFKVFEFEFYRYSETCVEFNFQMSTKKDHAGTSLIIGLFGYSMICQVYDTRHWDDENDRWEIYDNNSTAGGQ